MLIQITLQDLMIFLLCVTGLVVGVLLIPIMWNIKKVVEKVNILLDTNQLFLNQTIKTMPGIFDNIEQISTNVKEATDELKISVPILIQEASCTTLVAKDSIEVARVLMGTAGAEINETIASFKKETTGAMPYLHILEEVVQIIYNAFSSKK